MAAIISLAHRHCGDGHLALASIDVIRQAAASIASGGRQLTGTSRYYIIASLQGGICEALSAAPVISLLSRFDECFEISILL